MPTYADFGGWVISTFAGWFVVTADSLFQLRSYRVALQQHFYIRENSERGSELFTFHIATTLFAPGEIRPTCCPAPGRALPADSNAKCNSQFANSPSGFEAPVTQPFSTTSFTLVDLRAQLIDSILDSLASRLHASSDGGLLL